MVLVLRLFIVWLVFIVNHIVLIIWVDGVMSLWFSHLAGTVFHAVPGGLLKRSLVFQAQPASAGCLQSKLTASPAGPVGAELGLLAGIAPPAVWGEEREMAEASAPTAIPATKPPVRRKAHQDIRQIQ